MGKAQLGVGGLDGRLLSNPLRMRTMGTLGPSPRIFHFGDFTLDAHTGELTRDGDRTRLREQPLQLLIALLEQPGELVAREQLIERVWTPGTYVDFDRGLNKAINHLREALGDSAENPQFIETLPRKGYRFIAKVIPGETATIPDEAPEIPRVMPKKRAWSIGLAVSGLILAAGLAIGIAVVRPHLLEPSQPASLRINSLAVIPLENLSADRNQEYFADSLTDQIITDLAKMGSTRVISRASVLRYKGTRKTIQEIGRDLNADAIIEGTVTRSDNRMRITAQLIQVSTDMHLWAEAYEQSVIEPLDLQSRVATDIARKVDTVVHPLEQDRAVNAQAYGFYLKGRYSFYQYSTRGWQQAIEHFRKAIELDPNFASAYAGLADTYLVAGAYGVFSPREALTQGKAAAQKAAQLNDKLASAHYALATAYTWYDWDWNNAEKEFQRAMALNPDDALGRNWYGGYLSLLGRHNEAVDQHERARQLEPFSLVINANLARALYWARRYDEAIAHARSTLDIDPQFSVALFWLEGSLRHKQMFRQAIDLRKTVFPEHAAEFEKQFQTAGFQSVLRRDGDDFKKDGDLIQAARCYAQVAQKKEAIALLESCLQRRCSSLVTLKAEPDFDVLRDEPRFQKLVQQVGLP
jgi:TolB-like protein/DNA-binding winged helix-turn-helix (wHTH) protein/Tfp pilus assembly protein PilF